MPNLTAEWGAGSWGGIPWGGDSFSTEALSPAVLAPTRYVPPIALVQARPPSSEFRHTYNIFIAGVDVSAYVTIDGSTKGGMTFNFQLQSRAQLVFWTKDLAGAYAPNVQDTVLVYQDGSTLIFNGFVDQVAQTVETGTTLLWCQVTCVDYGVVCDRRAVGLYYPVELSSGFLYFVLAKIVQMALGGTRISLPASATDFAAVGDEKFFYVTVTEAFNALGTETGTAWVVTADLELIFFYLDTGWEAAPISFTSALQNWITITLTYSTRRFANKVIAKSQANLGALWTDTFTGATTLGGLACVTTYPLSAAPLVTVNGNPQIVIDGSNPLNPNANFNFYWLPGGVFGNPFKPPLSSGDVIEVTYPSALPFVGIASDNTSIAANGESDEIVEAGNIIDPSQLSAIATQELVRAAEVPAQIKIVTRAGAGLQLGQLLTVNTSNPNINAQFIITQIQWKEVGKEWIEYTITGSNPAYQRLGQPARYLGDLISRSRTAINSVVEHISFVVAGTVEGLTNPGLTTGTKPALAVASKYGIAGFVTLGFNSINTGTPTTLDIVIDIFQNGISVFGTQKLVLSAGSSNAQQYTFVSVPLKIQPGDVFTYEVLEADPTAKDGFMDLVVLG